MMKKRRGFTLIELLVVIAIIAVLMAILMPALKRAKEQGQRAACISGMKQLTLGWILYCDDNNDKIVNGAPQGTVGRAVAPTSGNHANELPWVGNCVASDYGSGGQLDLRSQKQAIMEGAMWPYVKDLDIYACPTGIRDELLTYAAMDGVNGLPRTGTTNERYRWLKKRTDIRGAQALRLVYIDEGWVTPDSFATHWDRAQWWDDPPVRHGDGTNLSFADGHAEYHKWVGMDTIKEGRNRVRGHPGNHYAPTTDDGTNDLVYVQKSCWGDLGYRPSTW